jgi:AraC-like DNA-binding protein
MGVISVSRSAVESSACTRVFEAARRLLLRRGQSVTLSEIARHAGIQVKADRAGFVDSLLEHRFGDVVELVTSLNELGLAASDRGAWSDTVREILAPRLDGSALSLRSVARMLAVSTRTLQRRLAEEGTNWRAELDAARCNRAAHLLRQGLTHELTATRVGYSSSRALRRARRRWDRKQVGA